MQLSGWRWEEACRDLHRGERRSALQSPEWIVWLFRVTTFVLDFEEPMIKYFNIVLYIRHHERRKHSVKSLKHITLIIIIAYEHIVQYYSEILMKLLYWATKLILFCYFGYDSPVIGTVKCSYRGRSYFLSLFNAAQAHVSPPCYACNIKYKYCMLSNLRQISRKLQKGLYTEFLQNRV